MDDTLVEASPVNDVEVLAISEPVIDRLATDADANQDPVDEEEDIAEEVEVGVGEVDELNIERKLGEGDGATPQVGMTFKTFEEVYDFYNSYARRMGFGTKIRRSWYNIEDGQCNKVMLTCCKEGKRVYKNSERSTYRMRLSARTDCQARVKVQKKYSDGLLYLVEVNLEHNHPVNPSMSKYFRSHKQLNDGSKKQLSSRAKRNRDVGQRDMENEDGSKSHSCFLVKEDIDALVHFFSRMQAMNSNFSHLMDFGSIGQLRNVFWADSKSKTEYQYFHDVIIFDTTYLTDNYETPLALFLGVNHHGHLVLLGCGLLSDRTTETYNWLFKSWLSCMSGNPPGAIVTDQSEAIRGAASEVFPGARQRLSLWHIMQRIQENLGGPSEYKAIKGCIKKAVYDSLTTEEFEGNWQTLIEKNGLQDDEWLKSIYEARSKWVPVFLKNAFWAGVLDAQHNKSRNCFFDGYLHPKTSVKQFISRYEAAMQSNYEKEAQADMDSFQKSPQLVTRLFMEDQLRKVYTVDMFKKFQEEVKAILYCTPSVIKVDGPISIFEVREDVRVNDGKEVQNKSYEVKFDENELVVQCICCSFQSRGILCRHALSVYNSREIYELPSLYIVDRWRKDYKQQHTSDCMSLDVLASKPMERYDNLVKFALRFAEVGAISEDRYDYALKMIRELTEELVVGDYATRDVQCKMASSDAQANSSALGSSMNYKSSMINGNGDINGLMQVRRRGRPPKKRKEVLTESFIENNNRKACERKPEVSNQHDVLQIAHNFDSHMWTQEGISLTEQVSPTNLSIGNHFGLQINHQHTIDNQSGIRWSFQQMFQHPHTQDGPPGPWAS